MPDQPIFSAIRRGNLGTVKQLVLADPAVLNETETWNKVTPLMLAIDEGRYGIADWLVEHRGQHDLDTPDFFGQTVLHHTCTHSPPSVVRALVAAGANPSLANRDGITPLMIATSTRYTDTIIYLLQLPAV